MILLPSVIVALATLSAVLAVVLARSSGGTDHLPGCGPRSSCEAVTASRWGYVGRVPVAWPGAVVYVTLFAMAVAVHPLVRRHLSEDAANVCDATLQTLAWTAAGAAGWFLLVQAALLRRFCLYCSIIHACGIGIVALAAWQRGGQFEVGPVALAAALTAGLVVLQIVLRPKTWASINIAAGDVPGEAEPKAQEPAQPEEARAELPSAPTPPVQPPAPTTEREVILAGGRVRLRLADWPIVGSADARHVALLLMDPTCKTCRQMQRLMMQTADKANEGFAVVLVPVPQDRRCNPQAAPAKTSGTINDTCQLTRLLLTLHRYDRAAHEVYSRWILDFPDTSIPPFAAALTKARQLTPQAMASAWPPVPAIEARLRAGLSIFNAASARQVPTLVFPRKAVVGLVPSVEKLLEIVDREYAAP